MRTRSWFVHGARLVVPAFVVSAYGCAAGELQPGTEAESGHGGTSGHAGSGTSAASGTSSGARGGSAGASSTGGGTGATSGSAGAGATGGGASGGTAGTAMGGGAGAVATMGGTGGSLAGAGGAGGASSPGGAGGASGAGGSAPMAGTGGGMVDPCATVTCGSGETCMNGTCMCMSGMLCGTACVDTQSDQANCGTCGMACAADGSCVDGKCVNPMCNPDTQQRSGHITHYSLATSMVACHWPTNSLPQYYGAMNEYDWNMAGVCGACVEITNGGTKLTVQIVDECPYQGNEQWCFQGSHHIDLNNAANGAINGNSNPAVTWKYVSCTPMGNVKYYFDSASQQYYLAVSPMNYRNLLAKVEVKKGGTYSALTRSNSNMFELKDGAGTGALTFRLTDIYNHVITDSVMMNPGQTVEGTKQFAACP